MQRLNELKSSANIEVETVFAAGHNRHVISLDKGIFFWTEGFDTVSYEPQSRAYANMYPVNPDGFDFRAWVWGICHD